jgi:hypothetical protein
MKVCRRCNVSLPLAEFRHDTRYADGFASWCKPCHRARNSEWAKENRARLSAKSAAWREANIDAARAANKAFKARNSEKLKKAHAEWAKANRGKRNATSAAYKAAKLRATPAWADRKAIAAIYEECARLVAETGLRLHVDHIVPLQSDVVCGLHCVENLRIIPGAENESKRNNWTPGRIEQAQRQGDMFIEPAA